MIAKNNKFYKIFTLVLSFISLLLMAFMLITMKIYISIPIIILVAIGIYFFSKKISIETKRYISENVFTIITGISAFIIILFVLYLLLHIFLLGKSHLTLEFIFSAPAEGLTEGGIFPAIVGTALLVIIMSLVGVPIGTITAIYLTEYAKETSIFAKIIRFAVNTLAGVPAIVFGLFGLGFFIGIVGRGLDTYQHNVKIEELRQMVYSQESPFANDGKASSIEIMKMLKSKGIDWDYEIGLTKIIAEMYGVNTEVEKEKVLKFYKERTRPKWGQPALIWAALTMALLTLPVVIVSVEESIRALPKDLREASLALGATKLSTIIRVVIPGSITGILTGGILAVSRGAGEVAPILFTGAAYYLPDLPNALYSQFMELGYHIYVLTTQSTNVELTKPLQYATTLVLLILTFMLNFSAIFLRSRLRRRLGRN